MARYYREPEIRITGIIEDSRVGVWLIPHGAYHETVDDDQLGDGVMSNTIKQLFLDRVKGQELKIPVPANISSIGHVVIRARKVGWLPLEFHWPDQFGFPVTPEPDPLINIHQLEDIYE